MSNGWEAMWSRGIAPGAFFDASRAEPALQALIDSRVLPAGNVLVPGCGRGYAIAALAKSGERQVLGVDISATAVKAANEYLNGKPGVSVEVADFFDQLPQIHAGKYDLGYDCTFLCAIPPDMRSSWAKSWKSLLKPGGELITLIFPVASSGADPADGHTGAGPPFKISLRLVQQLLEPLGFSLIEARDVPENMVARGGREIIARWKVML